MFNRCLSLLPSIVSVCVQSQWVVIGNNRRHPDVTHKALLITLLHVSDVLVFCLSNSGKRGDVRSRVRNAQEMLSQRSGATSRTIQRYVHVSNETRLI